MSGHISAMDFDVMIGDLIVVVESMSATITDNRAATKSRGVPNGHVNGDVECSGEMEFDLKNWNIIGEAAKAAGSYRNLKSFDVIANAKVGSEEEKVEMFGCLLNITDLLNVDGKGGEKSKRKASFSVTHKDFVRINGVSYLSDDDVRDL